MKSYWRTTLTAFLFLALMTVILGLVYPVAMTGVGMLFPSQANGSQMVDSQGQHRGSSIIAQPVTKKGFFFPRPSAAGEHGYDAMSSSASNLSPATKKYQQLIAQRRQDIAQREGVASQDVPVDAITASGSGLDPNISLEYAELQKPRVARERGMSEEEVQSLIDANVSSSAAGKKHSKVVNVVTLNAALAERR